MSRILLLLVLCGTAYAASVVTTRFPFLSSGPGRSTLDAQGNIIIASNNACLSINAACRPATISKMDPAGKIIWTREFGEPNQRFGISQLALDAKGNIFIGAQTIDRQLPTVRPINGLGPGRFLDLAFLWQLTPDASRVLFASYLASGTIEQLQVDLNGDPVVVLSTNDFELPAVPPPAPRSLFVKLSLATSRLVYAIPVPQSNFARNQVFSIDSVGGVQVVLRSVEDGVLVSAIFEISPDGGRTSLQRMNLPAAATSSRIVAAPDGGWWIAGQVNAPVLATTPDAYQSEPAYYGYQRWEDGQGVTPGGPMRSTELRGLVVDPAYRQRTFAMSSSGLMRSEDNGWTWDVVNDGADFRNSSNYLVAGAGRVWLASPFPQPKLWVSDDVGENWREISPLPAPYSVFVAHPTQRETLFLAGGGKIWKSRDGGQSWGSGPVDFPFSGLVIDPIVPENMVAFGEVSGGKFFPSSGYFAVSRDGGETFSATVSVPMGTSGYQFDPFAPGTLYFASGGALQRTQIDAPDRTASVPSPIGVLRFGFHPSRPGVILAAGVAGVMMRSEDGGSSWTEDSATRLPSFATQLVVGEGGVLHLSIATQIDVFLAKVSPTGEVTYLTYLGGKDTDTLAALEITLTGQVFVAGQRIDSTGQDVFLAVFEPAGSIASFTRLNPGSTTFLTDASAGAAGAFGLFGTTSDSPTSGSREYFYSRVQP